MQHEKCRNVVFIIIFLDVTIVVLNNPLVFEYQNSSFTIILCYCDSSRNFWISKLQRDWKTKQKNVSKILQWNRTTNSRHNLENRWPLPDVSTDRLKVRVPTKATGSRMHFCKIEGVSDDRKRLGWGGSNFIIRLKYTTKDHQGQQETRPIFRNNTGITEHFHRKNVVRIRNYV